MRKPKTSTVLLWAATIVGLVIGFAGIVNGARALRRLEAIERAVT